MDLGFEKDQGTSKLFTKRDQQDLPLLVICKVVDDILLEGIRKEIVEFVDSIGKCFKLGHVDYGARVVFNHLVVEQ